MFQILLRTHLFPSFVFLHIFRNLNTIGAWTYHSEQTFRFRKAMPRCRYCPTFLRWFRWVYSSREWVIVQKPKRSSFLLSVEAVCNKTNQKIPSWSVCFVHLKILRPESFEPFFQFKFTWVGPRACNLLPMASPTLAMEVWFHRITITC